MQRNDTYIDVYFDFTSDIPRFWEGFWERRDGLGESKKDPDSCSKTMQRYHQLLYSKELPNGDLLQLKIGSGANYLTWGDFKFGSDAITTSFRYKKNKEIIEQVKNYIPNYKKFVEDLFSITYTIGGEIILPKRPNGLNQSRGCNPYIKDRWDLTLECIRKYYNCEKSPLYECLKKDKDFFDLFVDFRGFIDFFYLQDLVNTDCTKVNFWLGDGTFEYNPLPKTLKEYMFWIEKIVEFVNLRNERIDREYNKH